MTAHNKIDLNSDVGESFGIYKLGLDEEVIPLITSANIACGFHAGDPAVMKHTISLAKRHNAAVGAHPGFPDLVGFGRRNMDVTPEEIKDYVTYQIGALQAFSAVQGLNLQHVKPHGAIYNMAVQDVRIFETIAEALSGLNKNLILVALAGPNMDELGEISAQYGIRIAFEFFADRAYNQDGSLVSRREAGAVIKNHEAAAERALKMVKEGEVVCRDGGILKLHADTICVHGDNPAALTLIRAIRDVLQTAGIEIVPMGTFL